MFLVTKCLVNFPKVTGVSVPKRDCEVRNEPRDEEDVGSDDE